jgi:hypothetical protein
MRQPYCENCAGQAGSATLNLTLIDTIRDSHNN